MTSSLRCSTRLRILRRSSSSESVVKLMEATFSREQLLQAIERMADAIDANRDRLTELDAAIGDADHGINMARGFAAVRCKLPAVADKCIGTILKTVGMTLVSTVGGASGPLYGTAFMYAGNAVMGADRLTLGDMRRAATAAYEGIVKRGSAARGDKTMLDALGPVLDCLNSDQAETMLAAGGCTGLFVALVAEARRGTEATAAVAARRGRASFLGERSIGHIDPGAASMCLLIEALAGAGQPGEAVTS